jgi:drug/metabolite transporter (DMT)-like permease
VYSRRTPSTGPTGERSPSPRVPPILLFAAASLFFGTGFVGIKAGLAAVPPLLFAAIRFDVAGLLLVSYLAVRARRTGRDWLPRNRRDRLGVLVAGLFLTWLNGVFLFVGQQFTTSAAAAVVYAVVPVATPLFAALLLRGDRGEGLSRLGAVGLAVAFVGVVVVVRPAPSNLLAGDARGQLLVLLAALSVALGSVLVRRVGPTLDSLALTAWAMLLAAVGNHATSLALGESLAVNWTPATVLAVAYVGLFSTAVAFPSYFALIGRVGATRANLTAYAVPVVAAVAGVVILGESVAPTTVLGFLVVAAGFALVESGTLAAEVRGLVGGPAATPASVSPASASDGVGDDRTGDDWTGDDVAPVGFRGSTVDVAGVAPVDRAGTGVDTAVAAAVAGDEGRTGTATAGPPESSVADPESESVPDCWPVPDGGTEMETEAG